MALFFNLVLLSRVIFVLLFFLEKILQTKKKKERTLKQRTTGPWNTRLKSRAERDYSVLYISDETIKFA